MPQQVNLCTPILLTQKRYFSAQTMAQALAVFVVLGGVLCAYWVWSLNAASANFRTVLETQSRELASLQLAIAKGKAGAAPAELALVDELGQGRAELTQREKVLADLQAGRLRPGAGHAARLTLLAQSVPALVWVTEVNADERGLNVSGFTLDPAELNTWVARLAASALLQGQKLAAVKVENASQTGPESGGSRPLWSFKLVSSSGVPQPDTGGGQP